MKDRRPLSERFDLTYVRKRPWPGDWSFWLSVTLAVAVGAWLAALAIRGDQGIYTAGPLTKAHAMFGADCVKCHQQSTRMLGYKLRVNDDACLKCHAVGAHPDAARAIYSQNVYAGGRLGMQKLARDCAACHVEHGGLDPGLSRVGDPMCVRCHGNLASVKAGRRVLRLRALHNEIQFSNIQQHIHAFATDHPNWDLLESRLIDTTPIRFEHQVHMNPDTPQMQARLTAWIDDLKKHGIGDSAIPIESSITPAASGGPAGMAVRLTLACDACHQADPAGRYMKPIVFAQHCAPCHGLGTRGGEAVPHGSGVAAFADRVAAKQVLAPQTPPPAPPAALRKAGPRSGPPKPAATAPAVTFENEKALTEAVAARVAAKRDELLRGLKPACAKCHGVEAETTSIPDPHIPGRWLTRSRFDHNAHRFVSCTKCHSDNARELTEVRLAFSPDPASKVYPGEDVPGTDAGRLRWTGRTRDVMLPDIHLCRECHTPRLAGDACVMCHDYHGRDEH